MKHENYDLCFPDQPVVDLYLPIWASLPAFRDKPAFVWVEDGPGGMSGLSGITYGQLNASVESISLQLLHTLQRGDTAVILCAPGLELVEVVFGCQRAGISVVPMAPPNPSFANENYHHLVRVLSQTKAKAAIASQSYINRVRKYVSSSLGDNRLTELLRRLRWIPSEELKGRKVEDAGWNMSRYNGCKAEDVYLIQYTSGATGIPKPVLVTAGAAAHNVRVARTSYDLHPNSVIVSWLPQYHDCGLMFLLLTIVSGATSVLTSPNAFITRPRLWLEMISEYKATCTPVPSFTLPLVVKRGGVDKGITSINLGSMKNLIIVNEPIYNAAVQEFVGVFRSFGLDPTSISPSYGLAENCTFVSTAWRSEKEGKFPIHKNLLPSAKLPSSREEVLAEEIEILVVNEETCEPVADGIEGEIWISSPSNASGYLHHPSLTREVFNSRLKNRVGGCYVRTGDRGIVRGHDRFLFVTGRCSDIIKVDDGIEVHAHFLETAAFNSCSMLLRAGCLTAFETIGTVVIVAELQRAVGDGNTLRKICVGIKDAVMNESGVAVGKVVLVKSGNVPKTTSGKVQRWLAKDKLERGGALDVVMKMEFGATGFESMEFTTVTVHEKDEKKTTTTTEVIEDHQGNSMFLATINTGNHLSLRSSL